ncbi:MAG: TolC family protein [Gemmatimonadota bacterium]
MGASGIWLLLVGLPIHSSPPLPPSQDTLTLDRAISVALRENPEVRQAAAAQSRAHADRRANLGAFLPSVDGSLGFSRTSFRTITFPAPEGSAERLDQPLDGVTKSSSQGLNFGWDLLRGGSRFAELARSGAETTAADRRVTAAERRVVAEVKRRYYEALKQQRLVEVAERQLAARRQDLEETRRRYELAALTRADLLGAEIQLGDAELALLDARDLYRQAIRDLRAQMGVEEEAATEEVVLGDVGSLPSSGGLEVGALVRRAFASEPELAAIQADLAAASASLWMGRAGYLPNIRLGYGIRRSESLGPEGSFFVFDPSNRSYSFSVSVSWNLFDGFQREQQTAQASAARRDAQARLLQRRLEVESDVRNFTDEIRRRAERLAVQDRNLELARERLAVAREQYRLGAITFFQLQTAIGEVTTKESQVIQERYEYLKAWASLEERVGEAAR